MIQISLLGSPFIQTPSKKVVFSQQTHGFTILGYVAASKNRISRHKLAGWLWAEEAEEKQKSNFRWQLSQLKRVSPALLGNDQYEVWWEENAGISLDTHTFHQLSQQTDNIPALKQAIALYRGSYLEGVQFDHIPEAEQWLIAEREHWKDKYCQTLEILINTLFTFDQLSEVNHYLNKWIAIDEYNEQAHRLKMRLFARQGERQKAIAYYQAYAQRLATEYEDGKPTLATQELARHIYHTTAHQPQLPPMPKNLIGRDHEVTTIKKALANPNQRLITIIGGGGIGKTRLAIEIAHAKQHAFLDHVYFVHLANATTPQFMAMTIGNEMAVSFGNNPNYAEVLAGRLIERETLLILDNFEHLHSHSNFITQLLNNTKRLKIIVTSRFRLHLSEEYPIFLSGLPVASREKISPAIELFVQSGQQFNPDFELTLENLPIITKICQFLDGSPLGIELAASWVRVLSCLEILEEIEGNLDFLINPQQSFLERHNSFQTLFTSTWKLLTADEQSLLRRLAVFSGTFSQKAVRAILQTSPQELAKLVDRSVLAKGSDNRFYLHSLIAPYAADLLALVPDEYNAVRQVHADYYVGFVQEQLATTNDFDCIEQDLDNCLGAWHWAIEREAWQLLDPMLAGLFQYYDQSHKWQEGVAWLDSLWVVCQNHVPLNGVGAVGNVYGKYAGISLTKQGYFHHQLGNLADAKTCLQQGIPYLTQHGNPAQLAQAQQWLANAQR